MKKQTITQGTLILMAAGFITKVLGMVNRIVVTRLLGEEGVGMHALIMPTLMLLATFASIGLPVAIPTLISRANVRHKKVLSVSLIIAMCSSFIVSIILLFTAQPLATSLLRAPDAYLPLITIGPLLFCISLSTILKAYFQGEQNMTPSAVSTLVEQVFRMVACIVLINLMLPYGFVYGVVAVILASIVGEISAIFILLFMFLSHIRQNHTGANFKPVSLSAQNFKDVIVISVPTTGGRLIGSFTHFLEPIIVVQALFTIGYTSDLSKKLYGAVAGFALPLLLMPSFISQAVTQSIIPPISQAFGRRQWGAIHHHLNTAFQLSFLPSGLYTVLIMIFPVELMNLLYNTSTGSEYLLFMAPFFLLLYFQSPLTATLQSINKATLAMTTSLVASALKITLMIGLMQVPRLNIQGLVIAVVLHIVILTAWHYWLVRKETGYRMNLRSVINGILAMAITYMFGLYLKSTIVLAPTHTLLNMFGLIFIISIVYLCLILLCDLFPKERFNLKGAKKNNKPIIA